MRDRAVPASQPWLLIYLGAVVGPTLFVLTLGVLAVRRQDAAVEALGQANRHLLERQVAGEIERALLERADAALRDPGFNVLITSATSDDLRAVDAARAGVAALRVRHPLVRDIFVVTRQGARYPRVQPALPGAHAEVAPRDAQALQVARRATAFQNAGRPAEAQALWSALLRDYGDTYTPSGRPYAVLAAIELRRHHDAEAPKRVARQVMAGTWTVTPAQATYFLTALGAGSTHPPVTPFQSSLALGAQLQQRFVMPAAVPMNQTVTAAVADAANPQQLFYRATQVEGQIAGIALDLAWARDTLLQQVAGRVVPGATAWVTTPANSQASLPTLLPFWRVAVAAPAASGRRLGDLATFAAGVAVVLGVLVLGVVLLLRDVARESQVNRLRADLVSGVSHELKAPLSVIRMYAETIDAAPDASTTERQHFTAAIVQETDRLRRLIDDVVDFSRIQQGERTYRIAVGSLPTVVQSAAERFREYAELHGFTLRAEIDSAIPPVPLDPIAVEQAIFNLLDNAFKYSGESTVITLRLTADGRHAVVEVEDSGVGIPPEEQPRIFDRFHRGSHDDRGGYGLGLYLVQHVVHAHGGGITVVSAPGHGSRFQLRLPLDATEAAHG